jgi:hypothetical protein
MLNPMLNTKRSTVFMLSLLVSMGTSFGNSVLMKAYPGKSNTKIAANPDLINMIG